MEKLMLHIPVHSVGPMHFNWIVCLFFKAGSCLKGPKEVLIRWFSSGLSEIPSLFSKTPCEKRLGNVLRYKLCIPGVAPSCTRQRRKIRHDKTNWNEAKDWSVKLLESHVQILYGIRGTWTMQVLQTLLLKFLRHLMPFWSMPNQCFCLDQAVQQGTYVTFSRIRNDEQCVHPLILLSCCKAQSHKDTSYLPAVLCQIWSFFGH